jgi:hypothetical protein
VYQTYFIDAIKLFLIAILFSCATSSKKKQGSSESNNNEPIKADIPWGPDIPPEYVRLEGKLIHNEEVFNCNDTECTIQFIVKQVLGRGATFSDQIMTGDTLKAKLKYGVFSIKNSSQLKELISPTSFIAEIQGNPLIEKKFTIYKFQKLN